MQKTTPIIAVLVTLQLTGCAPYSPSSQKPPMAKPRTYTMPPPSNSKPSAKGYIGMPIEKAQQLAASRQLRHRVVMRDGKWFPVTKDFRPNRLNFSVMQGIVTGVTKG